MTVDERERKRCSTHLSKLWELPGEPERRKRGLKSLISAASLCRWLSLWASREILLSDLMRESPVRCGTQCLIQGTGRGKGSKQTPLLWSRPEYQVFTGALLFTRISPRCWLANVCERREKRRWRGGGSEREREREGERGAFCRR